MSIATMSELIYRTEFDTSHLVSSYPAQLHDHNKRIVFDISSPRGGSHSGAITVSRWKQLPLVSRMPSDLASAAFEVRDDYFGYEPTADGQVDWYLNFAHCDLFCAYGGPLFAQDEMQVTEHPALASLRHALMDSEYEPLTVERDFATPILIMGVERRCSVATNDDASEGRPYGLYGNNFSRASEEAIRTATRVIDPPTISNIIAMEAPACGDGKYSREQIEFILSSACAGFEAAVNESRRAVSPDVQVAVHTGYWGCGAYGGNRELMPLLQMIAASWAGLDRLVFHTGGDSSGYKQGLSKLQELARSNAKMSTDVLLAQIEESGYRWGVSDGN